MVAHRFRSRLGIAAVALINAGPALAAHAVVYTPTMSATVTSTAGGIGRAAVANGSIIEIIEAGGGASASVVELTPTRATLSAQTQSVDLNFTPFGGVVSASGDLARGTFSANVNGFGPNAFGNHAGGTFVTLADTLFFTNTSGGDVSLTFRYAFDGQITDPNRSQFTDVRAGMQFGCLPSSCFNDNATPIRFAGTGQQAGDLINAYIDGDGVRMFARNIFGDQNPPFFDHFQTWQSAPYGSGGSIDGWMQTTLLVPTGLTSLGITGYLSLDCRGGASCNFGNTGTFSFAGGLPTGLSFTSASGVFLTDTGSAIPEPASWALLIAGFGLVGAVQRRRRTVAA